jgi:hypothetical protein
MKKKILNALPEILEEVLVPFLRVSNMVRINALTEIRTRVTAVLQNANFFRT